MSGRSRAYIENENPETLVSLTHRFRHDIADQNMRFWFTPDDKELRHEKYPKVDPGIYNFDVIPYESIMIGQYAAWAGPENDVCKRDGIQKRNVISLGYSRELGAGVTCSLSTVRRSLSGIRCISMLQVDVSIR